MLIGKKNYQGQNRKKKQLEKKSKKKIDRTNKMSRGKIQKKMVVNGYYSLTLKEIVKGKI